MTETKMTSKNELEILSRFTNHVPDKPTLDKMATVRTAIRSLARIIDELCPESREKATALTQLSFVMMSANSAIVQKCPINQGDLTTKEVEHLISLTSESGNE